MSEEQKEYKNCLKPPFKAPGEKEIIKNIEETTREMAVIATLKSAIANYLLLDDIYEYEDNTSGFCLILGRLEISLIRRKQSLDEDKRALEELA